MARRFDSYIKGFALRYRVDDFVTVDMAGAIPLESLREESLDEARRARALLAMPPARAKPMRMPRPTAASQRRSPARGRAAAAA